MEEDPLLRLTLRLLPEAVAEERPLPEERETDPAEREAPLERDALEAPERVAPLRVTELLRDTREREAPEVAVEARLPPVEAVPRVAAAPVRWEPAKDAPGLRRPPPPP